MKIEDMDYEAITLGQMTGSVKISSTGMLIMTALNLSIAFWCWNILFPLSFMSLIATAIVGWLSFYKGIPIVLSVIQLIFPTFKNIFFELRR